MFNVKYTYNILRRESACAGGGGINAKLLGLLGCAVVWGLGDAAERMVTIVYRV